jgi:hypothetical protein
MDINGRPMNTCRDFGHFRRTVCLRKFKQIRGHLRTISFFWDICGHLRTLESVYLPVQIEKKLGIIIDFNK